MDNISKRQTSKRFKYTIDEFADIKIIRYRTKEWNTLSLKQKELIFYLSMAAKCGRDILWCQNFKYNLAIRKTLENILNNYKGERQGKQWEKFLIYAKRVFFSNGIHHHYSEYKIIPLCSQDYMLHLIDNSNSDNRASTLIPIMYDAQKYHRRRDALSKGDLIKNSSVDFYDNVSQKEAEDYYSNLEKENPKPSHGLNSRLIKRDGFIIEERYTTNGLYGKAIEQICQWLEKAMECAENSEQKHYIGTLIEYYRTGDLTLWDKYSIEWVKDNHSKVDFINGFIETYNDPIGRKGSWEGNVSIKDEEACKRTQKICENAQWFENHSPIDDTFRKKEVRGVSAKVINVAMLGGDCYPYTPIGINLPNADWIRKEYGSKSVTIANITRAYDMAAKESPKSILNEFTYSKKEIELCKKYGTLCSELHTDLHECLGHGSGQLLEGVSSNALKEYGSTIEECRADLFALYFIADSKLLELGLLPNADAYKAEYINYIRNGLLTQCVKIKAGECLTESHTQNRQMIALWCYTNGMEQNVIEKKIKKGKTYFVINDYVALRGLFAKMLNEVQQIKSTGDYHSAKSLVERYGINLDAQLHQEVLERYATLELKPYSGFVNPEIKPVRNKQTGHITNYSIRYNQTFLQQMLRYGKEFGFLEPQYPLD